MINIINLTEDGLINDTDANKTAGTFNQTEG